MGTAFDPCRLLDLPLMANLATSSPDGPRNLPVWFLWEEDALWMPGDVRSGAVRRLGKDPRCAVEIVDFGCAEGRLAHLGLRGSGMVQEMDPDRFRRLLAKYLGPDQSTWNEWFLADIAMIDDPDGRLIRLVPDSIFTNNVSYFRTGPDLAWP